METPGGQTPHFDQKGPQILVLSKELHSFASVLKVNIQSLYTLPYEFKKSLHRIMEPMQGYQITRQCRKYS